MVSSARSNAPRHDHQANGAPVLGCRSQSSGAFQGIVLPSSRWGVVVEQPAVSVIKAASTSNSIIRETRDVVPAHLIVSS